MKHFNKLPQKIKKILPFFPRRESKVEGAPEFGHAACVTYVLFEGIAQMGIDDFDNKGDLHLEIVGSRPPLKSFIELDALVNYLTEKYEVQLRYIPVADLLENGMSKALYRDSSHIIIGTRVTFPVFHIRSSKLLVGILEFQMVKMLSPEQIRELSRLVDRLLTPVIQYVQQNSMLLLHEGRFLNSQMPNVLPLSRQTQKEVAFKRPRNLDVWQFINHPVVISATQLDQRHKLAFDIHRSFKRWAFVPFEDLSLQWTPSSNADFSGGSYSGEDLNTLGFISIWIPEILELSPAQQMLLIEFFSTPSDEPKPLILAGTHCDFHEIQDSGVIYPALVALLSKSYLHEIEQPEEKSPSRFPMSLKIDQLLFRALCQSV